MRLSDPSRALLYGKASLPHTAAVERLRPLALLIFAVAAAAILAALAFEHVGGYQPCALCLKQRTPYYVGVPVAGLAVASLWLRASPRLVTLLFAIVASLMLYNAGLAVYHAGVEWAFWQGPASCAPSTTVTSAADLLAQLNGAHPPSCTSAPWRLLGLSFAGWNAIVSTGLATLSLIGMLQSRDASSHGSSTASQ